MDNFGDLVIGTILSGLIFSFLLHILNKKVWGIFVPMQRDLCKLSNTNRRILNLACHLLVILISVFLRVSLDISSFLSGVILGLLISIVDICFKDSIMDNKFKV